MEFNVECMIAVGTKVQRRQLSDLSAIPTFVKLSDFKTVLARNSQCNQGHIQTLFTNLQNWLTRPEIG